MARRSVLTASSGTRAGVPRQDVRVETGASLRETAKDDVGHRRRGRQSFYRGTDRNLRGRVGRETVHTGRDRGERQGVQLIGLAELKRTAIARAQRLWLAAATAVPDRADRMARGQPV